MSALLIVFVLIVAIMYGVAFIGGFIEGVTLGRLPTTNGVVVFFTYIPGFFFGKWLVKERTWPRPLAILRTVAYLIMTAFVLIAVYSNFVEEIPDIKKKKCLKYKRMLTGFSYKTGNSYKMVCVERDGDVFKQTKERQ